MNNTLINKNITDVSHSVRKIRVEEEGILPDYCADIVRVVKVEASPVITDSKVRMQDGNIFLEATGKVDFNVIYSGDEGHCECYSFSGDFCENIKNSLLPSMEEDNISCTVIPIIDNSVCKVQSPRKIIVRCDIILDTTIKGNCLFESINAEAYEKEGKSEIMKNQCKLASLSSSVSDSFEFSEEIKLPASSSPMERILSCTATVTLENTSIATNSLNFWGTLGIYCMYLPESDDDGKVSVQSFYQPIEISGKIETDHTQNDLWAMGNLSPSGVIFEILTDNFGENRILKVTGSYNAQFDIITNDEVELTKDIYGIGCDLETKEDNRSLLRFIGTLKENTAIRETVTVKEEIERIEGCRGEIRLVSKGIENGRLFADYKLELSGIACSKDGESGIKEFIDLHLPLNLPSEINDLDKIYPVISASVGYIDCKVSNGRCEVNFDVSTTAHIFEENQESFISGANYVADRQASDSHVFYYPSASDTLWSIGKHYGVSLDELKRVNSISDGELKRVMKI